jgi:hypothetical protein
MTVSGRIRIQNVRVLSDNHYVLKTTTFEWRRASGRRSIARPTIAATAPRYCATTLRMRR